MIEIAIWIIAVVEVLRFIQNGIQLWMLNSERKNSQFKRATDAFVESLKVTDKKFIEEVLEKAKENSDVKARDII